jgi:hypothetical protein
MVGVPRVPARAFALRLLPVVGLAAAVALLPACEVSMYSTAGVEASSAPSPQPSPADDESSSPLPGWSIQGHARSLYAAEVDPTVMRDGHATIRFHPTQDAGGNYATFMTSLDAAPMRGRRAHAVVWVRTEGVTSRGDVWLRAQGAGSAPDGPGLATSLTKLAASGDFTPYELRIDVPDEATTVQLGLGLAGPGMLWMDGVKVEAE